MGTWMLVLAGGKIRSGWVGWIGLSQERAWDREFEHPMRLVDSGLLGARADLEDQEQSGEDCAHAGDGERAHGVVEDEVIEDHGYHRDKVEEAGDIDEIAGLDEAVEQELEVALYVILSTYEDEFRAIPVDQVFAYPESLPDASPLTVPGTSGEDWLDGEFSPRKTDAPKSGTSSAHAAQSKDSKGLPLAGSRAGALPPETLLRGVVFVDFQPHERSKLGNKWWRGRFKLVCTRESARSRRHFFDSNGGTRRRLSCYGSTFTL